MCVSVLRCGSPVPNTTNIANAGSQNSTRSWRGTMADIDDAARRHVDRMGDLYAVFLFSNVSRPETVMNGTERDVLERVFKAGALWGLANADRIREGRP